MPASIATFQVMLGTSKFDAVNYVRNLCSDIAQPYLVPDSAYMTFAEDVAEDFSRYVPLDIQLGDPSIPGSPFTTVARQMRYVCSAGNGFSTQPVVRVNDVLYQATNAFSAASEISYLALLPFSPINRFLFTPSLLDSPSERILRDQYLSELDHYGRGYFGLARDPTTGLPCIDLYPEPQESGIPIYVRYQTNHAYTTDSLGNYLYPTVPEPYKRQFSRLLFAMVLEQMGTKLLRGTRFQAGLVSLAVDAATMLQRIAEVREEAYLQLGGAAPVVFHTF